MAKKIQHRIRRSNNEGSIFQRKSDGKWVGSITVGHDEKGQQKKKFTRKSILYKIKYLNFKLVHRLTYYLKRASVDALFYFLYLFKYININNFQLLFQSKLLDVHILGIFLVHFFLLLYVRSFYISKL